MALDLTDANAASGIATDLSGNGNNGAYVNITPSGNLVAGPTPYITNAASFSSADVNLSSVPNLTLLDFGGPITMEAWAQLATTPESFASILAKGYDGANNYDEISLKGQSGQYYGGTYDGSDNNTGQNVLAGQQTTNWVHLVSTYDGTNWNLYVNALLVGHTADTVGAIEWQSPWAIGNGTLSGNGRLFQGNICQVALYNYALTPAQVLTHYYEAELNSSPATSVPIITSQPQPQAGFIGGSATFSVSAISALPSTNQWYAGSTPLNGQTNTSLVLTNLSLGEANTYHVVVGNANGTTNSIAVGLSVTSPITLEWSANANNGTWDVTNSADWINESNSTQTVFVQGDAVVFDDTVGVPTAVTVSGTVEPSLITVNSSVNNFSLTSGTISGAGSLVKKGTSTLSVASAGNFTGTATISGGVLVAGNDFLDSVASITITNNSTLDFGGSSMANDMPVTVSGTGAGGEGAIYNSVGGLYGQVLNITLAGDTTFGALGSGGARWDLAAGSQISGPHKITINWGATSGGYGEWNSLVIATNVGDIEVTNGTLGLKSLGASFGNPASNFIVDSGAAVDFWTGDSGYARNFHALSGGAIQFETGFPTFVGNVTLDGGGEILFTSGFQTFAGNLTLQSNSEFVAYGGSGNNVINGAITLNGTTHLVLGDANFTVTNVISGPGGIVWDAYNHELFLQASNTYSGPTVVNGGSQTLGLTGNGSISHSSLIFLNGATIDVSGRADDTLTLANGQTLGGVGAVNGLLVVPSGATLAPAGTNVTLGMTEGSNPTGTLGASNNITLNGNTLMKLNGSGVSDELVSSTKITYGGTLTVANISGASLAVGNSFQLFSAPSMIGSFSSISPATPGPGLAWDTTQLNSFGTLNVIAGSLAPKISNVHLSSGKLVFSGSGGTANANFVVYSVTNIVSTNWIPVLTNAFDGSGDFSVTNLIAPGVPQSYYRIK